MSGTWQHGKPDQAALLAAMDGLRDAADVPLDLAQRVVLRRKTGLICDAWQAGVLALPDVRAADIDGRLCGVVGGVGSLLTSWMGRRMWRVVIENAPRTRGVRILCPQGLPGATGNVLRDIRDVAARTGVATVVAFDVRRFYPRQDALVALDAYDRLTGRQSHDSRALRQLYPHAHASDPDLVGLVQGLAPSPALAELLLRPLDRALRPLGIVERWADNPLIIIEGRHARTVIEDRIRRICAEVGAAHGLDLEPHEFAFSTWTVAAGFEVPLTYLGLQFVKRTVGIAPQKLLGIAKRYGDLLAIKPDRAISYAKGVWNTYRTIVTSETKTVLARILSEAAEPVASLLSSSLGASPSFQVHSASGGDAVADGSPPGAPKAREADEREVAPAAASRSSKRGRARARYADVLRDVDRLDAEFLETPVEHNGKSYVPFVTWLAPGDAAPNALGGFDPGQDGSVREALARAEEISQTGKRGANLALICMDFVATNGFLKPDDPARRARYLARIANAVGVKIAAVDATTHEPVLIDRVFLADDAASLRVRGLAAAEPDATGAHPEGDGDDRDAD